MSRTRIMGAALVVAGTAALAGGMWMLWPPLAVVLVGLAALGLGVLLVVEVG